MTLPGQLVADASRRLADAGIDEARADAQRLFRHCADRNGARFHANGPHVHRSLAMQFENMVRRRERRIPVSQIVGKRAFYLKDFEVDSSVLDPRPETETLVSAAIARRPARMLELGVGSGCVILSILDQCLETAGTGVDIDTGALRVAQRNADRHGLADRCTLFRSNWFSAVEGRFDLIVSNPPYLSESDYASAAPEIRLWEPRHALTAGEDGLDAFRAIARNVDAHLAPGGALMLEIGPAQREPVAALFAAKRLALERVASDLDGRSRVLILRRCGAIGEK